MPEIVCPRGRTRSPRFRRSRSPSAPTPPRLWKTPGDATRIRHAAGLLLLYPAPETGATIVLTERAATLRHPGQISLPGGVVEAGETLEQAALREAHEEVGLALEGVEPLGVLTPVDIPVSGFRLHPIVAASPTRPVLRAADGEVARVIEAPLRVLLDPASCAWRTRERDGLPIDVPMLVVANVEVWGATAMVLAEFLTLLG